jgi:hypothetical protein
MDLSKLWPEEAKRLILGEYKNQKIDEYRALQEEYRTLLEEYEDLLMNYQGAMDFILSICFKSEVSKRLQAWEEMGVDPSQEIKAQIIALYKEEIEKKAASEYRLKRPSEVKRQKILSEQKNFLRSGKPRPSVQRSDDKDPSLSKAEKESRKNAKKGSSAVKAHNKRQAAEARRRREEPAVNRIEAIQRRLSQVDRNSKEAQRLRSELGQLRKPKGGTKKNEVDKSSKQKRPKKQERPKTYASNYGRRGQHTPGANPGVKSKKVRQAPKGGRPKFFYGVLDFAVDLETGETDLDEEYRNSYSRAEEVAKEYYRFLNKVQSIVGRAYWVPKSANGDKVVAKKVQ